MDNEVIKSDSEDKEDLNDIRRFTQFFAKPVLLLYHRLAPRAYTVIMFGALFSTLAAKFFHSVRQNCVNEYFSWVLADVAVLLGAEAVLAVVCLGRPRKWTIRTCCVFAAVICTWSVMNAGWLIRTGTQILPTVILPLIRDPINALGMIGVNLAKMPVAAVILLGPSVLALAFFFSVLSKPTMPAYNRSRLKKRLLLSIIIVALSSLGYAAVSWRGALPFTSVGMRYNAQLRAVVSLIVSRTANSVEADSVPLREIPAFDKIELALMPKGQRAKNHNVVIIVLEGIQYNYTSLPGQPEKQQTNLTPYITSVVGEGVKFTNARSTLTHTTKALFSILTGRYPSVSQDLAEAVPAVKPYASIATILKRQLGFRTAFFQSAKGNFEARPALVYNLGFDKFWAREELNDPNTYLGYLGCDEYSMLDSIVEWIKSEDTPFLLTIMCSVTHDPYEVPGWFAKPAKKPQQRYKQAIAYTDSFLAALDTKLARLNLADKTIFCVIGDHGEAFGEHGQFGHERIAFEEALRIPFCIRAPGLIKPNSIIDYPVSSIDLTPTLLALLDFDVKGADFDGLNVLSDVPEAREVYFSGWLAQSPAGFVTGRCKYVHNTVAKTVSMYNLENDPTETNENQLSEVKTKHLVDKLVHWSKNTIFQINQKKTGSRIIFDRWSCRWNDRICSAKFLLKSSD
jgi:arylsulfatase A-like enzyme